MKALFAVMSCNRMHYAKNCIESILKFVNMDRIGLLICDNNTIEEGFDSYLNEVANRHKGIIVKQFKDRNRNELYRAMNYAVKHCQRNGYDVVNFLQDDYQYLYRLDKQLDDVEKIFDMKRRIVQISSNLAWARKKTKLGRTRQIDINGTNYLVMAQKWIVDTGYTRVAAYKRIGFYPRKAVSWEGGYMHKLKNKRYKKLTNGEQWFAHQCRARGWKRMITLQPCTTLLYDCAYVRGNKRYGEYFPPPNEFYIKPFSPEVIEQVNANNKAGKRCYIEEMCEADGWTPKFLGKHSKSKKVVQFSNEIIK